jgi:NADPH-dependent 2,4-dienoyl-CoA reductase/sulfur reductase-like enzyme
MASSSSTPQHIVIIGGVAAGATAAARLRRLNDQVRITLIEQGPYVSYANCGLPYHISGDIVERSKLFVQTPEGFHSRYAVDVKLDTAALDVDVEGNRVLIQEPGEGSLPQWLTYNKLILAQGGNAVTPTNIPGVDGATKGVFKLWRVGDMDAIHAYIETAKPKHAVVIGGGFVGLEMAEAFHMRGIHTTVVEFAPTVMAIMDTGFGHRVANELRANGVDVYTGVAIKAYDATAQEVEMSDGRRLPADLLLFSIGVRPELGLAKKAGLLISETTGALVVNDRLQTSEPDIYAAGDMVEVQHHISGRAVRMGLAGPANRQGRIAASNVMGADVRYPGVLGSSVCKIFEATVASTGLSEKAAKAQLGADAVGTAELVGGSSFCIGIFSICWTPSPPTHSSSNSYCPLPSLPPSFFSSSLCPSLFFAQVKGHHADYFPGAKALTLKVVYDKQQGGKLLGAQAFGYAGVEKRIDAIAVGKCGLLGRRMEREEGHHPREKGDEEG